MATRFYLPSTGTASISPAYGAGWRDGAWTLGRLDMVTSKISSAFDAVGGVGDAGAAGNILCAQYLSAPLAAQSISGTISGVIRAQNSHSATNGVLAVRVALCASDATNIRELLAIASGSPSTMPPEFVDTPTTPTNRRLEQGTADYALDLTTTSADANDRLIVEVGYNCASFTATRYAELELGDNSGSDLAINETGTDQFAPWVEFTMDVSFASGGGSIPVLIHHQRQNAAL